MRSNPKRLFDRRILIKTLGSILPILVLGWILFHNNGNSKKTIQNKIQKPCIAIVIDDFGYGNDHVIEGFLSLNVPLSYAVIPGHNYSSQFAREAHSKGFEILVHMPMESHESPEREEPLMIKSSMNSFDIENEILNALHELPEAVGMNNHQGSKVTELEWVMEIIGRTLKRENKYFLDSRTSPNTKAEDSMKKLRVRTGHRNIFLDNELEEVYVEKQLDEVAELAKSDGFAIGIGHARELTLLVLEKKIPELVKRGYQFCLVSDILN
ncbi:MAG: divergent polysaccharide deacetylase family protein [Candidatus Marinimicrobia bacterium]|jgi:hypothetical protein|nr:divergent polysaccharide deacetylase family protein [Candidatus Neomarinimicrobiota bacterium]